MSEIKQICVHYMSGNCKYGTTCTKLHVFPTTELLQEIEKKGSIICNFYPNCKFSNTECKKIHIDIENQYDKELLELRRLYLNLVNYETKDSIKLNQIERVKFMIKHDIEMMKDTWNCLTEFK